jgi:hypothetical protein
VLDEHGVHVMDYEMRNDLMAMLSRGAVGCTEDKTFVFIIDWRTRGRLVQYCMEPTTQISSSG